MHWLVDWLADWLVDWHIQVDSNLQAKIADFGLSRIKASNATMTQCGTAAWTAPEILSGQAYSEKSDIYSFAIILWELYVAHNTTNPIDAHIKCNAPNTDEQLQFQLQLQYQFQFQHHSAAKKKPFRGMQSLQIAQIVIRGARPKIPEDCPSQFATLIKLCWKADPNLRPSLETVIDQLNTMDISANSSSVSSIGTNPDIDV
jgi:serine/threonine protein kinase